VEISREGKEGGVRTIGVGKAESLRDSPLVLSLQELSTSVSRHFRGVTQLRLGLPFYWINKEKNRKRRLAFVKRLGWITLIYCTTFLPLFVFSF
jgi:hypothetical protein